MTHKPIKNLSKMASKDANAWARAEMFFGEGSGIRRRHLQAEITEKMDQIPGYEELYFKYYAMQDMTKHAEAALRERKNIDRAAKAGKNLRAIKSGRIQDLSTGVFVVIGVAYVAHATGYDKKAWVEAQVLYAKAKARLKRGDTIVNQFFQKNDGAA